MALLFFGERREVDDQFTLWRVEPLVIDLHDSIAVFLIELENPSVEVISFVGDVLGIDARGENEAGAIQGFGHQGGFEMVMGVEHFEKQSFFLIEDILITSAISDAKEMNGFSRFVIAERDLCPGPLIERGVFHVGGKNGKLSARFQEFDQQSERRRIFLLTKHT